METARSFEPGKRKNSARTTFQLSAFEFPRRLRESGRLAPLRRTAILRSARHPHTLRPRFQAARAHSAPAASATPAAPKTSSGRLRIIRSGYDAPSCASGPPRMIRRLPPQRNAPVRRSNTPPFRSMPPMSTEQLRWPLLYSAPFRRIGSADRCDDARLSRRMQTAASVAPAESASAYRVGYGWRANKHETAPAESGFARPPIRWHERCNSCPDTRSCYIQSLPNDGTRSVAGPPSLGTPPSPRVSSRPTARFIGYNSALCPDRLPLCHAACYPDPRARSGQATCQRGRHLSRHRIGGRAAGVKWAGAEAGSHSRCSFRASACRRRNTATRQRSLRSGKLV
jgi:hypothetical protein